MLNYLPQILPVNWDWRWTASVAWVGEVFTGEETLELHSCGLVGTGSDGGGEKGLSVGNRIGKDVALRISVITVG